jgi:hypothetical protein
MTAVAIIAVLMTVKPSMHSYLRLEDSVEADYSDYSLCAYLTDSLDWQVCAHVTAFTA